MTSVIKSIALVSTLVFGMAGVGQANASTITPPRAVTGWVVVKQSIEIKCGFTGTLRQETSGPLAGSLVIANPVFNTSNGGNILCGGAVKPNAGPWVVTGVTLTGTHTGVPVGINGVGASTVLGGSCVGNITGSLSDSGATHALSISGPQTLPGTPSSCQVLSGLFAF